MKTIVTAFLLVCGLCHNSAAQQVLKKDYLPGVVRLEGDYLYIATTEVSNRQYGEFLNWLKTKGRTDEYWKNFPDTVVWRNKLAYNEPYMIYYFRHPAYADYPVVGVTQRQAQNYCNWAAARIMEEQKIRKTPIDSIAVRLPSETEWMKAARGGLPESAIYPWEGSTIRMSGGKKKDEGKIRLNIRRAINYEGDFAGWTDDAGFITTPVESYWPNNTGIYNICGNVSEWLEEPGKTKGGNWHEPAYNARIDVPGIYDGDTSARSTIGFRYVVEIISCNKAIQSKPLSADAGSISKQMRYIPDSGRLLFASAYEVSNSFYHAFLNENHDPALAIQDKGWDSLFRYDWYKQYGWHPAYDKAPVVNISCESAVKFCEWLTDKYNNSEKRQYKKVVIRLPSEAEWELAARGGRQYSSYPWGGPYVRNSRGCYIANFCPLEEQYLRIDSNSLWHYQYPGNDKTISRKADGAIIPASVDSYFPNDYGLFNCAGNVAEMLAEKGISKGGSWNSNQYYIQIDTKEINQTASPYLGFRIFMQVLEK